MINDLERKILEKKTEIEKIKNSVEYIKFVEDLNNKEKILSELLKKAKEYFIENDLLETDHLKAKFIQKKEINKEKFFQLIDDIDLFVSMSNITQKSFDNFTKKNPQILSKEEVEECFLIGEKSISSISVK